uniref:NADH-ubiquinone oxidoreductase chain 1 n=1 Tax=Dinophilus gyrociliatus TaxID=120995 RepID=A0A343TAQ9_9ANNE|nr:NADH dehydrogenase subunit 1 [Dinophilus gyrociliatus]
MMFPQFITILILMVTALLAMAFFTLIERKALGYIQLRKGPNKPSLMGIPVPFADAIKLFLKEKPMPAQANSLMFFFAPTLALCLALMLWSLTPTYFSASTLTFSTLGFLAISSMSVYPTLGAGWLSNSKYSLLGAFRAIAQTISYEVSMALIFISFILLFQSFSFSKNFIIMPSILLLPLLALFWLITIHAETNRTPFDFAEGESELVSGFNTEYSAGPFALIFMAEYASILAMSMVSSHLFFSLSFFSPILFTLLLTFISFLFIWTRGSLPRMRYDFLMSFTWKGLLPAALFFLGLLIIILT